MGWEEHLSSVSALPATSMIFARHSVRRGGADRCNTIASSSALENLEILGILTHTSVRECTYSTIQVHVHIITPAHFLGAVSRFYSLSHLGRHGQEYYFFLLKGSYSESSVISVAQYLFVLGTEPCLS